MARRASRSVRPILCAVLDIEALGEDPRSRARALFAAGVDWIQLRDRICESETFYRVACQLVEAARETEKEQDPCDGLSTARRTPRVILNRRVDIALAAGAHGVHLGFDAVRADAARKLLGDAALVGVSIHSAEEAGSVSDDALRYAHLAPIWDPVSKPASRPPLGLGILARAAASGPPLLAQGGLDPARAVQAIEAGAIGIAVIGRLGRAPDPGAAARQLRVSLDRATPPAGSILRNQSRIAGDRAAMPGSSPRGELDSGRVDGACAGVRTEWK